MNPNIISPVITTENPKIPNSNPDVISVMKNPLNGVGKAVSMIVEKL